MRNINDRPVYARLAFVAVLLWGGAVYAQTTSFTYQGRLTDGAPANNNYDLQFTLWDAAVGPSLAPRHHFLSLRYERFFAPVVPVNTFTVTTTADNGSNTSPTAGSLREAIVNANNSGGGNINFSIPGSDPNCNATTHVCTITPVTRSLPDITAPVTIDGYTQPGASPNTLADGDNAVLLVELNGNGASGLSGLNITSPNCTVRGLIINGFNVNGIALYESAATNTHIEGNFIGTDATGTVANSNGNAGIYFQRANGNRRLTFMQF